MCVFVFVRLRARVHLRARVRAPSPLARGSNHRSAVAVNPRVTCRRRFVCLFACASLARTCACGCAHRRALLAQPTVCGPAAGAAAVQARARRRRSFPSLRSRCSSTGALRWKISHLSRTHPPARTLARTHARARAHTHTHRPAIFTYICVYTCVCVCVCVWGGGGGVCVFMFVNVFLCVCV